eukprot:GHVQ01001074.1.p1 GENE.GHVQ01001074.1~~GHVQ01001074.1.p1  ORF type:complete len:900 (+),score=59.45 GHVQ01001074.1:388-3087(+)
MMVRSDDGVIKYKCYRSDMTLAREARLQVTNITMISATSDFMQLAIGTSHDGVSLFRGDLVKEKSTRLRTIKIDQSVTGVHVLDTRTMFVCTRSYVSSYSTLEDIVELLFLDNGGGADIKCSAVVESSGLLLVMRDEAVFTYHSSQGNLSAIPCEGVGRMLKAYRYFFIALTEDIRQTDGLHTVEPTPEQTLTICSTLPEARFIAFCGHLKDVQHIVPSSNSIFAFTKENGRTVLNELDEKDITERLDVLIRKRLFEWAREMATVEQQPEEILQEIYRVQADWLYDKHNYDQAVEVYSKTIGYIEPSYVIQKYLEAQRLRNLTEYLQRLLDAGVAEPEHTVLLLKCYTKLRDVDKMEEFVRSAANKHYDLSVAVSECRVAGYSKLAADIALRQQHDELYVAILVEDYRDYRKALIHLQNLPTPTACAILLKYGRPLIRYVPEGTIELTTRIIKTDRPNVEVFIPLFADNSTELQTFLADIMAWQTEIGETASSTVFTTYLELLLRSYKESRWDDDRSNLHRTIMKLLKDHAASEQDLEAALCLCRLYHHEDGLVYACEKSMNYQLPLSLAIEKGDVDAMLSHCVRCGSKDPTLWTQALTYLSTRNDSEHHILEVLKQVERLKILRPLAVLSILKNNTAISFGAVKEYVLNSLRTLTASISESDERIEGDVQEIGRMKHETFLLRTKARIFQSTSCFQCGLPLESPSVHFFCMHSYHSHCVHQAAQCPICGQIAESKKMLREQREFQARNADDFFKFLRGAPDGFAFVAEYYGKGMFPCSKPTDLLSADVVMPGQEVDRFEGDGSPRYSYISERRSGPTAPSSSISASTSARAGSTNPFNTELSDDHAASEAASGVSEQRAYGYNPFARDFQVDRGLTLPEPSSESNPFKSADNTNPFDR